LWPIVARRVRDQLHRTINPAVRINDPTALIDDPTALIDNPTAQIDDLAVRINDSTIQINNGCSTSWGPARQGVPHVPGTHHTHMR
jgi:hypothetical protein